MSVEIAKTIFEDLKKKYKKQIKGKSTRMRFNNFNSISFSQDDVKISTCSHSFYYGTNGNFSVHTTRDIKKASSELINLLSDFWSEYVNKFGSKTIVIYCDHADFTKSGFIKLNGGWVKKLDDSEDENFETAKNLYNILSNLKKDDATFDFSIQENSSSYTSEDFSINYYKTGFRGTLYIKMEESGLLLEEKELKLKKLSVSKEDIENVLSEWMDIIYKRNRLNTIFENPKDHFNNVLYKFEVFNTEARDKIYEKLIKNNDAEEIEMICAELKQSVTDFYTISVRQKPISLFFLIDHWFVVFKESVYHFKPEQKNLAINQFKEIVLEISLGEKLNKELETLTKAT